MLAIESPVKGFSLTALGRFSGDTKRLMVPIGVFVALCSIFRLLSSAPLGFFDYQYISSGGLTLAIAAMGATIVILSGGFDLSVGAIVSLVNVIVSTSLRDSAASQIEMAVAGVLIGAAVGAVNGAFIAFLRLQSIVVTLATLFVVSGLALFLHPSPGGAVPAEFSSFFTGAAVQDALPSAMVVLIAIGLVWLAIKNSRFGTALYAVGSDEEAAEYSGISVRRTKFLAYTVAGGFYGLAGLTVTAVTSTGDALVGQSMVLETFAAVVLGGTLLSGGRGGCIGTIIGAYSLMLITNLLLVLGVPAFYSTAVQSIILVLAAIGLGRGAMGESVRWVRATVARGRPVKPLIVMKTSVVGDIPKQTWFQRNRDTLSYAAPSYGIFVLIVFATALIFKRVDWTYLNSLLLLSSFLIVLALGQGTVILIGGLDLSLPWTITLCGILIGELSYGRSDAAVWAIPAVLALGALIGALNGFFIVFFRLPAIVVTLAMNGILQGAALVYTKGIIQGLVPGAVKWFMSESSIGIAPVVPFIVVFAMAGTFLLGNTVLGRRIYAVGNSPRVAHLSGVNVGGVTMAVYVLSGLCSALVGIMLAGFSGRAILGMGDQFLLPSIAVVVIGGTLISGGRGKYVGMLGGVLLMVSLQILLAGTTLPDSVRQIIFGLVVLAAIVALRDRSGRRAH
jgi:ribose transport system permease protein